MDASEAVDMAQESVCWAQTISCHTAENDAQARQHSARCLRRQLPFAIILRLQSNRSAATFNPVALARLVVATVDVSNQSSKSEKIERP